jgi:hypothetical protein
MIKKLYAEIEKINDAGIKDFTRKVVDTAPVNSWKMPSSRDHHMKDECGEWGNLIHTLRVVRVCDIFADIKALNQEDRDILRSAAILHDSCKHGVNAEAVYIYREHPRLVDILVKKSGANCDQRNKIMYCVNAHMGRWGNVPCDWIEDNEIYLSFMLHAADCIEARLDTLIEPC